MMTQALERIERRLSASMPRFEWELRKPLIEKILGLKMEKNVVILAHNYQVPEIFYGIADVTGDSLALARESVHRQEADAILFCGVHFMAETAKLFNPNKPVLIADLEAGCSLAESITGADVRALKAQHPGAPVVTYVNSSAEVKAESDICCTSGNALAVVESLNADKVIFLPDGFLASYVARQTEVEIISWAGTCIVHEEFTADQVAAYRAQYPGLKVLAHPECHPDVQSAADLVGSTAQMSNFVAEQKPGAQVALITECSMSDNLAVAHPHVELVRPCSICPHMKKITLEKIVDCLETFQPQIEIPEEIAYRAKRAVERMLEVSAPRRVVALPVAQPA
ncbi:MAG: quinolinate synthase NadA [Vulcanimicrobiota bacterium]